MGKARIRAQVREARRAACEARTGRTRQAEAEGLAAGWTQLLDTLDLTPAPHSEAPRCALFAPTVFEPDVRGILAGQPRFLLPRLGPDVPPSGTEAWWVVPSAEEAGLLSEVGLRPATPLAAVPATARAEGDHADPTLTRHGGDGNAEGQDAPALASLPHEVHPALAGDLAGVRVVLLPALSVDLAGTRLGQGGGWYDRALLSLPADALRIAVVFDEEVLPAHSLPREAHDLPVHAVLTPTRTLVLE